MRFYDHMLLIVIWQAQTSVSPLAISRRSKLKTGQMGWMNGWFATSLAFDVVTYALLKHMSARLNCAVGYSL